MKSKIITSLMLLVLVFSTVVGQKVDFSSAAVLISPDIKPEVQKSAYRVLDEEIYDRTGIKLNQAENWKNSGKTVIALTLSHSKKLFGKAVPVRDVKEYPEYKSEGFRIFKENSGENVILWIIGADSRAVIFGIGELLRTATLSQDRFILSELLDFSSSPEYPLRGHQLGYRNTANSYDAWSIEQYDQYIRDLVIFGTNAIENIPLGGNGDESVLMKEPRKVMNVAMSNICNNYDIDYWVWTPATIDLHNDSLRQIEIKKHEVFYKDCPRLNDVFFPGGDPGHNHPSDVMPFLKELQSRLVKYHPDAGMWISLQGFSQEQIDYFYTYLKQEKPDWLRGVVSGPSSPSISETRFRLPQQYKHRHYPDITHNVRCDYPAFDFDQAFALTIGREGINPQPVYYAKIHSNYAQFTDGFVSYSDGCHDDVNKVIWSQRGWNPDKNVRDILIEYSRFFFGSEVESSASDGILALENNWIGPLVDNGSVETTFAYWNNLNENHPELSDNWRWIMLQLRANYDTYIQRRQINEKNLEIEANEILEHIDKLGIKAAMTKSLEKINEVEFKPISSNIKLKIENYCADLFNLIGLQTSVELYQASNSQRGCILDFVDYPLNNRWWYADEFKKIQQLETEEEKKDRLETIRTWENPGTGSYYDDVSNIAKSPHVTTTVYDAVDFGWWDSGYSRMRLSSQVYQNDPKLEYKNLDPNARYFVRVSGYGDALLRIDGHRMEPILYNKEVEQFKEFIVPRQLVGDGKISLSFDRPEESHIRWKFYSRISDVWLIKR